MGIRVHATILEELLNNAWHRTMNGRVPSRLTPDLMERFIRNLEIDLQGKSASIAERGDWWIKIRYRGKNILAEYDYEDASWFAEVIR